MIHNPPSLRYYYLSLFYPYERQEHHTSQITYPPWLFILGFAYKFTSKPFAILLPTCRVGPGSQTLPKGSCTVVRRPAFLHTYDGSVCLLFPQLVVNVSGTSPYLVSLKFLVSFCFPHDTNLESLPRSNHSLYVSLCSPPVTVASRRVGTKGKWKERCRGWCGENLVRSRLSSSPRVT